MASITKAAFGGTAANLRSFFRGRKFLKLFQRLTVGQTVPEIPLSVGSKPELLHRAFVFAKFPYTSPYTHAFVRVCILPCIYVYMYIIISCTHSTEYSLPVSGCMVSPATLTCFITPAGKPENIF